VARFIGFSSRRPEANRKGGHYQLLMNRHLPNGYLAVGVAVLMGACLGCGTREYERRLKDRGKQLEQGSAFAQMHAATTLPGTSIQVQVPQAFDAAPLREGSEPERFRPPLPEHSTFVTKLKLTYEGAIADAEGGRMSFYCHLIVTDVASFSNRPPPETLAQELRNTFSDSVGAPQSVECQTPAGLNSAWYKVSGTDTQKFRYVKADGQTEYRETNGIMEFYARQEGDLIIVILWRVPTHLKGKDYANLDEWGPLTAGSVTVKQTP